MLRTLINILHLSLVHSDNFAVILGTSRYWYNYRHSANALAFYDLLRSNGYTDSNIILFTAHDHACDCRNIEQGKLFLDSSRTDLYSKNPQIDFIGEQVTGEALTKLLSGRNKPFTPRNKRLSITHKDRLLIFFAGHSGEGFMKFQDFRELPVNDLEMAFGMMEGLGRYKEIFWIADTCKAATLHDEFTSKNIIALSSSGPSENSYAHGVDADLGVLVADRFSYHAMNWLTNIFRNPSRNNATIADLKKASSFSKLGSTTLRDDLSERKADQVNLKDFFYGNQQHPIKLEYVKVERYRGALSPRSRKNEDIMKIYESYGRHVPEKAKESRPWILYVIVTMSVLAVGNSLMYTT